ncbi:hypothetical protein V6N12_006965 [Hibiscus sabdariffa]|uniref:Uncharacterized protein n=1 Tax=Hibiscus sabdariffa TaxID=183260 RepID=A0ABR2F0C7_9ROSI
MNDGPSSWVLRWPGLEPGRNVGGPWSSGPMIGFAGDVVKSREKGPEPSNFSSSIYTAPPLDRPEHELCYSPLRNLNLHRSILAIESPTAGVSGC